MHDHQIELQNLRAFWSKLKKKKKIKYKWNFTRLLLDTQLFLQVQRLSIDALFLHFASLKQKTDLDHAQIKILFQGGVILFVKGEEAQSIEAYTFHIVFCFIVVVVVGVFFFGGGGNLIYYTCK